jgi:uncharacterized protein (DUF362 family)
MMNKTKVALIRCEKYDDPQVLNSIKRGIDLLGGISLFVKSGDKIVLKPNILIGSDTEKCVTTHPAVFRSVGSVLKEAGAIISYGDSPAFGKYESGLKRSGCHREKIRAVSL